MCRSSSPRRTRSRPGLRYKNLVNTSHQHIQNTLMKLKSKGWMSNCSGECRLIKLVDTWDINFCPRTISIAIFQHQQSKVPSNVHRTPKNLTKTLRGLGYLFKVTHAHHLTSVEKTMQKKPMKIQAGRSTGRPTLDAMSKSDKARRS